MKSWPQHNWSKILLSTTALGALMGTPALAQDQDEEQAAFEEIIVTGVARQGASTFESSVSISSLPAEKLQDLTPRTTAEIFRNIPGIRSESSGGENNANLQVRGIPVTTGGAKFIQLQEDGLPVLSFGDITFGNADNFLRADTTISRIEAIRGGSASTTASNAPGAIINFISKTGDVEGGSIGFTKGINFDTTRVDFEYGSPIAEDWTFHIGGFYRVGEGARKAGFNAEDGGQVKANLTKNFDNGHIRLYFKHLNDRTIPYLPAPVALNGGDADPIPGFDFRDETLTTPFLGQNTRVDAGGVINTTDISDGVRAISTAFGLEVDYDIAEGWNIQNKARYADNKGGFVGTFTGGILEAENVAAQFGGTDLVYVNGPNAGQTITDLANLNGNGLVIDNLLFDVDVKDLSQFANDFKLTKSFETTAGSWDVSVGYYKSIQQVETEWSFNFYLQEALGERAALIDVVDNSGVTPVTRTVNGVRAFGIFDPTFDLEFDRDAIYGSVAYSNEYFSVDGSLRYENLRGDGTSNLASPVAGIGGFVPTDIDVNGDGVISAAETGIGVVDPTNLNTIDYDVDFISYSFGANYIVNDDLAVFARYSRGGVANGDRLVLGGSGFNAGGGLIDDGIGQDIVKQAEVGLKYRSNDGFIPGNLSLFLTGFYADSEESNFEITSGRAIDRTVEAFGLEVESSYTIGGFNLTAGATFTDADIDRDSANPGNEGNTPRRQADVTYQITPSYIIGLTDFGVNIVGTTSSFAQDNNDLKLPGFAQFNLFFNYEIIEGLTASFNANNLFNAYGLTEAEEGSLPANGIIRARPINGRTMSATIRYAF